MKAFVIDLETAARSDAPSFLPEVTAPANYKDAVKIEAYVAEKRATQLENAALNAETARVLCVGILRNGLDAQFIHGHEEAAILHKTWLELETREADEIFVTFNGSRFDWPMLARRCYALGVPVPPWFPADGRWPHRTHCDLFTLWQAGDRQESISLDRLARLCGLPAKTGSGADFAKLWAANRNAALDYLRHDLKLTRDLWQRMANRPFIDWSDLPRPVIRATDDVPPVSGAETITGSPSAAANEQTGSAIPAEREERPKPGTRRTEEQPASVPFAARLPGREWIRAGLFFPCPSSLDLPFLPD